MGEAVRGVPRAPQVGDEAASVRVGADEEVPARIGAYLARQRRLRGISLDELETSTRIPRRSLERLESGAFDDDHDGFARGFVRTVAASLGLPPEETVARMLPEVRAAARGGLWRSPLLLPGPRLLLLAGAVVATLVLWWVLGSWKRLPVVAPSEPAARAPVYRHDAVRELAERVGVGAAPREEHQAVPEPESEAAPPPTAPQPAVSSPPR